MDLGYTEFQELLRQTARDFAQRDFPIARHRELVEHKQVSDEVTWRKVSELGWPGLLVAENEGGSGGTWVDLMILLEEMGKALMPYTLLPHILAGVLIERHGTDAQKTALLPEITSGNPAYAVAIIEPSVALDRSGIETAVGRAGNGFTLSGTKHFVRGGEAAAKLIVAARLDDALGFFVVDKQAPGITVELLDNIGDDDQAKIHFANVDVPAESLLGNAAIAWEALDSIMEMGGLAECGYSVGLMARDTEMTVNYVKDRVQFGRPIGSFQAVRHQVADQATDVDAARYLTLYAAWALDEHEPDASVWVHRAKAWASDALRRVTRTGNQLHGGIGFSREYDLHFYYQRAKTSELMYGHADIHREKIAAALLDG